MKTFPLVVLSGLAVLVAPCRGSSENATAVSPKEASVFFLKLRMDYAAAAKGMIGWVNDPEREALLKLYDEKAPERFIAKSAGWLAKCPVDAKVHLMCGTLLAAKGDFAGSIVHRFMFYGLLNSIVTSGDGKSIKTAWKVISVDEEYVVLNYFGADVQSQALQEECDVMRVKIEDKPATFYFDVSIHLHALEKALGEKSQH